MPATDVRYLLEMGFTAPTRVFADPDHPGHLRVVPRSEAAGNHDDVVMMQCDATDLSQSPGVNPDLLTFGFDRVDLSEEKLLQEACIAVHREGSLTEETARTIRAALNGAVLTCLSGLRLTVRHVALEGLIVRTGGPNGMTLAPAHSKGMNGHRPAATVHADQDVAGTPLKQLMDGRAPQLFRHDSPDSANHEASLLLINLWIPINQITRPLVLADGRSVDRSLQQVHVGLPTDSFLERDEDQRVNDIWTFLFDPDQRWYFHSKMDYSRAYVFNTLSTPHSSAVIPGEDQAERGYRALEALENAIATHDHGAFEAARASEDELIVPIQAPPPLKKVIEDMAQLIGESMDRMGSPDDEQRNAWLRRSRHARALVTRKSVELRMVVSIDDASD